jgi:hypothetical protein
MLKGTSQALHTLSYPQKLHEFIYRKEEMNYVFE